MGRPARAAAGSTLLVTLPVVFLLSCSLFSPCARLLVQVPEPPPHWRQVFPDLCFTVQYLDPRGRMAEVTAEPGRGAWVECSRERNAPVVAWPHGRGGTPAPGELRPAGGFYPLSLGEGGEAGSLFTSWEDGCAALVVQRVGGAGRDMALFNVARLAACMREAADPWSWDAAAVSEAIAAGSFTFYGLDRLPCRDVEVPAGPGEWFLESPFAGPRAAGPDGTLVLPEVTIGAHMLYSLEGTRRMLWIGESEVIMGTELPRAFPRKRLGRIAADR